VTQPGIDRPYRVIVWGPGHIGGTVLREVITRDDLDLVGVKVYSEEKAGTDAGQLVGLPATGILATADLDEILALDADMVLFTPRPMDRDQIDSDVVALLQSGKNVISTESHHFPRLGGVDYEQKFIDAGVAGNATLHGTGIHPSFFAERLGVTLTGLFTEIDHVHFSEAANVAGALHYPPEIIRMMGFNRDPAKFRADDPGAMLVDHYYRGVVAYMVHKLFGVEPEDVRIESDFEGIPTDRAIDQDGFTIEAGKSAVAVRTHGAISVTGSSTPTSSTGTGAWTAVTSDPKRTFRLASASPIWTTSSTSPDGRVTSGCASMWATTPATTSRSPLGFPLRPCCSRSDRSSPPSRAFSITNQVRISATCGRVPHWIG
jgi:hypothetical protein